MDGEWGGDERRRDEKRDKIDTLVCVCVCVCVHSFED